ncbi:unnamed protein product [Prunus armeniaca]
MSFSTPLEPYWNSWIENQSPGYSEYWLLGLGEAIAIQSCDWVRSDCSIETKLQNVFSRLC